jgi:hypothetical protein
MNRIRYILAYLFFVAITTACSGDDGYKKSPSERVITGPFEFSQEWQEIPFDPPLEAIPHFQELTMLVSDEYKHMEVTPSETYDYPYAFTNSTTGDPIKLEVILKNDKGEQYLTTPTSGVIGWRKIDQGAFSFIGYAGKGGSGQYFYRKGTKIVSAKVRSNTKVSVEHLYWSTWDYWKAPERTWDDVKPSEVIHPQ